MAKYIDWEAVYKRACRGCTRHGDEVGSCYHEEPCEELQSEFASAPIADVEPVRHGRWIFRPKKLGLRPGYRCSECPNGPLWLAPDVPQAFKYCPHCGAKMDEEAK